MAERYHGLLTLNICSETVFAVHRLLFGVLIVDVNEQITIRRARSEDAEALSRIKLQIWLDTYQNMDLGISSKDIRAKDFLCKERIARRAEHMSVDDGINYTLVASTTTKIVGYGRAVKGDTWDEIVTLYVLPEWQGKGIGSKLLTDLLIWLGPDRNVTLGVVLYNKKAIRFYKKFGFQQGKQVQHGKPTFPTGKDLPETEMHRVAKFK